jgi:gamma-glutamyltranspeptidase/glutathione hydrolase
MRIFSFLLLSLFLALGACTSTQHSRAKETPTNSCIQANGMVVTAHFLASEVGRQILQDGGNAYDAAVAVQFALAVVYPRAGNIAGGGFAVLRTGKGQYDALDFREKAPLKAHRDMYLDQQKEVIGDLSQTGHLAVGVPGSVDGMVKLHQKYGRLPWEKLVQPAVELAEQGVVLTAAEAAKLNVYRERLLKANGGKVYLAGEKDWQAGEVLRHDELAQTLERIRDKGRAGFYEGKTADLIVKEMQDHKGMISYEDLSKYQSVWRAPVTGSYRGHKIISMPPPSSGGIALLQLLKGTEAYDLKKMGHNSAEHLHLMVELERRVYADRATWLGDPDFYEVPQERLLSEEYITQRMADIRMDGKTDSQLVKAGKVEVIESFETTHFSIVDREGNAIAITTTLNGNYGSKVVVKGGGFLLNNEMDDFSIKPGYPNQFGLVGGEANAIAPEKRMLSSMSPTIVEKDGKLEMLVGTPGGSTIITAVYQNILNVIDFGMSMQEAVNTPRIHSQWLPDEVYLEPDVLNKASRKKLEGLGHALVDQSRIGMMANILIRPDGLLEGAADTLRHKDSRALGY